MSYYLHVRGRGHKLLYNCQIVNPRKTNFEKHLSEGKGTFEEHLNQAFSHLKRCKNACNNKTGLWIIRRIHKSVLLCRSFTRILIHKNEPLLARKSQGF